MLNFINPKIVPQFNLWEMKNRVAARWWSRNWKLPWQEGFLPQRTLTDPEAATPREPKVCACASSTGRAAVLSAPRFCIRVLEFNAPRAGQGRSGFAGCWLFAVFHFGRAAGSAGESRNVAKKGSSGGDAGWSLGPSDGLCHETGTRSPRRTGVPEASRRGHQTWLVSLFGIGSPEGRYPSPSLLAFSWHLLKIRKSFSFAFVIACGVTGPSIHSAEGVLQPPPSGQWPQLLCSFLGIQHTCPAHLFPGRGVLVGRSVL